MISLRTALTATALASTMIAAPLCAANATSHERGAGDRWVTTSQLNGNFTPVSARHGRHQVLQVYVEFDSLRDLRANQRFGGREPRSERRADRAVIDQREAEALTIIQSRLGAGIRLVNSPRGADLVIRAIPRGFDVDFDVVDVDRRVKRKGDRRYGGGYAFERVKERARLSYSYDFVVRVPGQGRVERTIDGRVGDSFSYAQNLRPIGYARGVNVRDRGVERLLAQNSPETRRQLVRGLRLDAEREVAFKIARIVNTQAANMLHPSVYGVQAYDAPIGVPAPRRGRGNGGISAGEAIGIGIAAGVLAILADEVFD